MNNSNKLIDPNNEEFDVSLFINKKISLFDIKRLNQLSDEISTEQLKIQKSIFETLQKQEKTEKETMKTMKEIPSHLSDINQELITLNSETQYTEAILKSICDGVNMLGLTKKNIEFSIELITNLQSLETKLDECEQLLKENRPKRTLIALKQSKEIFDKYGNIVTTTDVFYKLLNKMKIIGIDIVTRTKELVLDYEKQNVNKESIKDYFALVNELFDEDKQQFINYLVTHLTLGYANAFPLNAEQSSLKYIEKRFKWFIDKMKKAKDMYDTAIPNDWRFWELLIKDFCENCKETFLGLLEHYKDKSSEEFTRCLIDSIKKTKAFEENMMQFIGQPNKTKPTNNTNKSNQRHRVVQEIMPKPQAKQNEKETNPFASEETSSTQETKSTNPFDSENISEITPQSKSTNPFDSDNSPSIPVIPKSKSSNPFETEENESDSTNPFDDTPKKSNSSASFNPFDDEPTTKNQTNQQKETKHKQSSNPFEEEDDESNQQMNNEEQQEKPQQQIYIYKGIISSCFDGYMSFYIEKEEENISKFIERTLNNEMFDVTENSSVWLSCKDIIMYLRRCSERCVFLTSGEPLREFCYVVLDYAKQYITGLQTKLMNLQGNQSKKETKEIKDIEKYITRYCIVMNTMLYTSHRIDHLIKQSFAIIMNENVIIQIKQLQTEVNQMINEMIQSLVNVFLKPVDDIMQNMIKFNWSPSSNEIDMEVEFVQSMIDALKEYMKIINIKMIDNHYLKFCNELKAIFFEKYVDLMFKFNGINEFGAQMLLMDYSQCKPFFLKLPTRQQSVKLENTPMALMRGDNLDMEQYTSNCMKEYSRGENILKILQIPDKEKAKQMCDYFFPEHQNKDLFSQIWSLRDVKKNLSTKLKFANAFSKVLN